MLPTFSSCPTQDFSLEVAKVQECVFLHMNTKKFAVLHMLCSSYDFLSMKEVHGNSFSVRGEVSALCIVLIVSHPFLRSCESGDGRE